MVKLPTKIILYLTKFWVIICSVVTIRGLRMNALSPIRDLIGSDFIDILMTICVALG